MIFSSKTWTAVQELILSSRSYTFKCHREEVLPRKRTDNVTNVWSVNDVSVHPIHGTFSTCGSDGSYQFWDKERKNRLYYYPNVGGSISATAFNKDGSIFAYAVSYDWSKGYAHNTPNHPNKIMLHPVLDMDCKPKQQSGSSGLR